MKGRDITLYFFKIDSQPFPYFIPVDLHEPVVKGGCGLVQLTDHMLLYTNKIAIINAMNNKINTVQN